MRNSGQGSRMVSEVNSRICLCPPRAHVKATSKKDWQGKGLVVIRNQHREFFCTENGGQTTLTSTSPAARKTTLTRTVHGLAIKTVQMQCAQDPNASEEIVRSQHVLKSPDDVAMTIRKSHLRRGAASATLTVPPRAEGGNHDTVLDAQACLPLEHWLLNDERWFYVGETSVAGEAVKELMSGQFKGCLLTLLETVVSRETLQRYGSPWMTPSCERPNTRDPSNPQAPLDTAICVAHVGFSPRTFQASEKQACCL